MLYLYAGMDANAGKRVFCRVEGGQSGDSDRSNRVQGEGRKEENLRSLLLGIIWTGEIEEKQRSCYRESGRATAL
jgi:hypothetical protein